MLLEISSIVLFIFIFVLVVLCTLCVCVSKVVINSYCFKLTEFSSHRDTFSMPTSDLQRCIFMFFLVINFDFSPISTSGNFCLFKKYLKNGCRLFIKC